MKRTIRAPRGSQLACKNWLIEAPYRMLQNNLDPQVAGDPDNLIVYGGRGKAARNWECFHAIVKSLRDLENDETLLVQSGKPVAVAGASADLPASSSPGGRRGNQGYGPVLPFSAIPVAEVCRGQFSAAARVAGSVLSSVCGAPRPVERVSCCVLPG